MEQNNHARNLAVGVGDQVMSTPKPYDRMVERLGRIYVLASVFYTTSSLVYWFLVWVTK